MQVDRAYDPRHQSLQATASGIGPAAGLLAILYALLAVLRYLTSPPDVAAMIGAMSLAVSAAMAGVWWVQTRRTPPLEWVPHLAGVIGALAGVYVLGHLLLTVDPLQSSQIMMVVVGVGALVEHRAWAAGIIAAQLGTWGVVAARHPAPEWSHFAAGLLSACLLALVLRAVFSAVKTSLEDAREVVAQHAIKDELTGLLNRRGFEVVGDKALATAQRLVLPIAMLFIDLDGMKEVNDNEGHLAGDARLVETGRRLASAFRDADAVARVGGDEFAVLLVGARGDDLAMMRDRACNVLGNASVGLASAEHPVSTSLVELMHRADVEMYRDKEARRAGRRGRAGTTGPADAAEGSISLRS